MSAWPTMITEWFCVLGGVVLTWSLYFYFQFRESAEGYVWRAAKRLIFTLLVFFLVETLFAWLLLRLAAGYPRTTSAPRLLTAAFVGVAASGILITAEKILLPKRVRVETLRRPLTRLFLKLRLNLRYKFASAIETQREQDVFDCQSKAWGLGIEPRQLGRRIRLLYELEKFNIARRYRDPSFLCYDEGRHPWEKFYLLVRHLGRSRLRAYLQDPPASIPGWTGEERRRRGGTSLDRLSVPAATPRRVRAYDDVSFVRALLEGEVEVRYTERPPSGTGGQPAAGVEPPDEEELIGESAEEIFFRTLAATWPVGPTVLHILSEGPKRVDELTALLRNDEVPNVVARLVEANLVEPRLMALFAGEDDHPVFRMAPTKAGARLIAGLKEFTNLESGDEPGRRGILAE